MYNKLLRLIHTAPLVLYVAALHFHTKRSPQNVQVSRALSMPGKIMLCQELKSEELAKVNEFYRKTSYSRSITERERVFVIKSEFEIVGAVCIETEENIQVLRGMYILPEKTNKKFGSTLLQYIEPTLAKLECYCIPYEHLKNFYGSVGFKVIAPNEAPQFLVKRFNSYCIRGLEVLIMRRAAG